VFVASATMAKPLQGNYSLVTDTVDSIANEQVKVGIFKKLVNYIAPDLDADEAESSTGLNIIGGPHFDSMTKFGAGIVASLGYRMSGCEAPLQPSVLSVKGDVSTSGFWLVEAQNNMILSGDSKRMDSRLRFEYMPIYFWGMEYINGKEDANKTKMKQFKVEFSSNFLFRLTHGLYFGPYIHWEFNKVDSIEMPHLLEGQGLHQRNYGVGLTVDYDTRDFITGPSRGVYLHFDQVFFPRFLWNGNYGFSRTNFRFSYYKKAWRGAIIAGDVRAIFNYGSPSWATMAQWGGPSNMRGYYRGRYRDNNLMNATVELRQHIWRWIGMVAWVGGGTVFHDLNSMHFLPNAGLGLRWAFRKHVNIRIDYGFGRAGESAFIFGINEAF